MRFYSTNRSVPSVTLREAVLKGLAADNGLFMPERINRFKPQFFSGISQMSFREIALEVALKFFEDDVEPEQLKQIVNETLTFDCPIVEVEKNIWSLELFHGPTLAFKDVGARFMARMLSFFLGDNKEVVNVLVATSGDTGSAVANGFLGVPGIRVFVLYPKAKVSKIQEMQFVTLGKNITAVEVEGTFDDCQRLVKQAFLDPGLNREHIFTSANSINVARFLPQAFYYFNAWARLAESAPRAAEKVVFAVPSGNFGNLTAGLFAREMGLPVEMYISVNNENDVVYKYLQSGIYKPRSSVETLANAMDVGSPSNFARILNLYGDSWEKIRSVITGSRFSDDQIRETIRSVYINTGYLCDPHGACGYAALRDHLQPGQTGIFLETAHPAKFVSVMEEIVGKGNITIPDKLEAFMKGEKRSVPMGSRFEEFREWLMVQ
jgi:threonine synthase